MTVTVNVRVTVSAGGVVSCHTTKIETSARVSTAIVCFMGREVKRLIRAALRELDKAAAAPDSLTPTPTVDEALDDLIEQSAEKMRKRGAQ